MSEKDTVKFSDTDDFGVGAGVTESWGRLNHHVARGGNLGSRSKHFELFIPNQTSRFPMGDTFLLQDLVCCLPGFLNRHGARSIPHSIGGKVSQDRGFIRMRVVDHHEATLSLPVI